jgi:hypothetical protein
MSLEVFPDSTRTDLLDISPRQDELEPVALDSDAVQNELELLGREAGLRDPALGADTAAAVQAEADELSGSVAPPEPEREFRDIADPGSLRDDGVHLKGKFRLTNADTVLSSVLEADDHVFPIELDPWPGAE